MLCFLKESAELIQKMLVQQT